MARYDIVEYKPNSFPHGDDYIRIWTTPNWLLWMLGFHSSQYAFRGSGTVWRHYPGGERAGTSWDSIICDLIAAENNKTETPSQ